MLELLRSKEITAKRTLRILSKAVVGSEKVTVSMMSATSYKPSATEKRKKDKCFSRELKWKI